jgi:general secretion pathway protein J
MYKNQGFTLIEVLIAATLFALITTLMFNGLRLATRSFDLAENHIDRSEQARLSEAFMRRELAQTTPMIFPAANRRPATLAFRGEADNLGFATILPAHRGAGGVYLVNLQIRGEAPELALVASYQLFDPGRRGFPSAETHEKHTEVLLEHLSSAQWSYFGPAPKPGQIAASNQQNPIEWNSRWESEQSLPQLVRFQAAGENLPRPVEWVFPIYAQVDTRLLQDIASGGGLTGEGDEPDAGDEPVNEDPSQPYPEVDDNVPDDAE